MRGEDSRDEDDVLLANLISPAAPRPFDIDDFNGFTFGGEYTLRRHQLSRGRCRNRFLSEGPWRRSSGFRRL